MPWGAAISAVASIGTGLLGASAADKASKAQQQAAREALGFQQSVYSDTTRNLAPFLKSGTAAEGDLMKLLGIGTPGGPSSPVLQMLGIGGPGPQGAIDPSKFTHDPGLNFQIDQGRNMVTNSAAAHGGLGGNALLALQQKGQGLANQGWQQYLGNVGNAWQQQISNVAGAASAGQNAAVQQGGFGQNFASAAGNNIWGGANAAANGIMGSANALGGGINNGIQALLTQLQAGGGSGGGGGGIGADGGFLGRLFGGGGSPSYSSLDPTGQSIAPTPAGGWGA